MSRGGLLMNGVTEQGGTVIYMRNLQPYVMHIWRAGAMFCPALHRQWPWHGASCLKLTMVSMVLAP